MSRMNPGMASFAGTASNSNDNYTFRKSPTNTDQSVDMSSGFNVLLDTQFRSLRIRSAQPIWKTVRKSLLNKNGSDFPQGMCSSEVNVDGMTGTTVSATQ